MDIAEVVQKIEKEYALAMKYDKNIASLYDKVSAGTATYAEASKFAEMSGQHIGNILASNLAESFPNGITTEDALHLVPPPLRENHEYVAAVAEQAQKTMNKKAGVGLNPIVPEFDEKRAVDLAEKVADGLTDKQIINECINESRHTVDNSMRVNAKVHEQVGMKVRVTREYDGVGLSAGRECTWCLERCGRDMTYSEAYDIGAFERHPGCGCVITYTSRKGVTTVQSKAGGDWEEKSKEERIQGSKQREAQQTFKPEKIERNAEKYVSIDSKTLYNDAKAGGYHSGVLLQAEEKTKPQLEKSIRSHLSIVNEHTKKIENPEKYMTKKDPNNPIERERAIKKWESDRKRNAEQAIVETEVWKGKYGKRL